MRNQPLNIKKKPQATSSGIAPSLQMTRFVNQLKPGQIFVTGDCVNFGSRDAVDQWLSRQVRKGRLLRVARGAFVLNVPGIQLPSTEEIAEAKAKRFGKKLFTHGVNALKEFFVFESEATKNSFATDGATTSFESVHGRISLQTYAPRKLTLGDTTVGKLIRALWHHRKPEITTRLWHAVREVIGRTERQALFNSCHILPEWAVKIIKYNTPIWDPIDCDVEQLIASFVPRVRRPALEVE